ncbi:MAG: hypothetical protein WBW32_11980 [Luteibacter sp.]
MKHRVLSLLISLSLAACAHAPPNEPVKPAEPSRDGKVSYSAIPSDKAGEYQMKSGQSAFGAQPLTNDPPAYPAALIASNLPASVVRAKVIVDGEGKVSEVRDLDSATDAAHKAFFAATREAAMRWTYTPMTMVQEREGNHGNITQTRTNAPFSRDYVFRFELKDGKPVVTASP